ARASGHATLYVSGLYGNEEDPDQQVRDIFKTLTRVSNAAGTDLRHLLKATYYCSADDVSRSLNALRPDYYDPERPPAASKAIVAGAGREDRTLTIDMIAAVREGDQ